MVKWIFPGRSGNYAPGKPALRIRKRVCVSVCRLCVHVCWACVCVCVGHVCMCVWCVCIVGEERANLKTPACVKAETFLLYRYSLIMRVKKKMTLCWFYPLFTLPHLSFLLFWIFTFIYLLSPLLPSTSLSLLFATLPDPPPYGLVQWVSVEQVFQTNSHINFKLATFGMQLGKKRTLKGPLKNIKYSFILEVRIPWHE